MSENIVSILSGDWHLCEGPEHEYKWELFDFLEKLIKETGARYLHILGDTTDKKDHHGGALVNRIIRNLRRLATALSENSKSHASIFMLHGNHDSFGDAGQSFFRFLHRSMHGRIFYFYKPTEMGLWRQRYLFLPHTRNFSEYDKYDFAQYDRVLFHQPIKSAMTENGTRLKDGLDLSAFAKAKCAIGGDVHCPQTIGNVTYTGAPYPMRYGDNYYPRVLVDRNGVIESLEHPTIFKVKVTIAGADEFKAICGKLQAGDKAKVDVRLPRAEFGDWDSISKEIRDTAAKHEIHLGGLKLVEKVGRKPIKGYSPQPDCILKSSPMETFKGYAKATGVAPELIEYGRKLLERESK